jgi:hypothetical protein
MNVLIILLGCNIYSILLNRIITTLNFIESLNKKNCSNNFLKFSNESKNNFAQLETFNITWFLSGGIKFKNTHSQSEAIIMKNYIENYINLRLNTTELNINLNWKYIIDEQSTNTAENLIRASNFLNQTTNYFDSIYISTSDYHYERAYQMINLIDNYHKYKWILADQEENNSREMEQIYIKNINLDVSTAMTKLYIF